MATQKKAIQHINRAYLHQKTWGLLDKAKEQLELKGTKLATGRKIGLGHYFCIQQLIELAYVEEKRTGLGNYLMTNRGNLAKAFKSHGKTGYNYIMDFESLGFIMIDHETTMDGVVHIIIQFTTEVLTERTDEAPNHASDNQRPSGSPLLGKVCHIHNPKGLNNLNNINNNSLEAVENRKSGTREAEMQQSDVVLYPVHKSLAKDVSEHKELTRNANLLWQQSFHSLWKTRNFRPEVQQEAVQLLALALSNRAGVYAQERKQAIKDFCQNPAYQAATDKKRLKMFAKFTQKLPQDLKSPQRAAFRDLNRAVQIQSDNCKKNGYETYYPTIYFAQYFDKAIGYALREKRTMQVHDKQNKARRAHAMAKNKIVTYADRAAQNLKHGFTYALNQLRQDYKEFSQFLHRSPIQEQAGKYLNRFLEQCSPVIKTK